MTTQDRLEIQVKEALKLRKVLELRLFTQPLQVKILALQAIADEPEFPSDMPDELWEELNGNRINTQRAMQNGVRLTKSGITERFLQALLKEADE